MNAIAPLRAALPLIPVVLILCVDGCERQVAPPEQPPPMVTVARPLVREVIEWDEYTGTLAAADAVDLRAQVSGMVMDAPFTEGAIVPAGQLLFQIDERPYKADLEAKRAAQAQAEAQLALNRVTLARYEQASPGSAVSQQEYDVAKANVKQATAAVEGAKAAVQVSDLNVNWCRVTAPIKGRVGRKLIKPGNLVTAGGTPATGTLLTTIQSVDPIYHYATVDERSVLKYRRLAAEGKRISARDQPIPCFLQLLNESGFPHEGIVDFVDNTIDPTTGTIKARGVYPNPDGAMTPGMFGRTRVAGSGRYQAVLVPDEAIGSDLNVRFVLTVDANSVVQAHPVVLGALFGTLRSIEKGISGNERVIINGLMKARPGGKVTVVKEAELDASAIQLTAPGSPTTQALPATRPFETPATLPAATRPTTRITSILPARQGEAE
jgi:RND family efflux transporter MFP subunit